MKQPKIYGRGFIARWLLMRSKTKQNQSCEQLQAAGQILRIGYTSGSVAEIFKKGAEIICAIEALGLLPVSAGYLSNRDPRLLHLSFQHNLDWNKLERHLERPDTLEAPMPAPRDHKLRYIFPLATENEGLLGLVKFYVPEGRPLTDDQVHDIQALLEDLAIVIAKHNAESINSHLAELAGVSPNEMYLIDAETLTIFQANRATQIKTGFRPDQILGKPSTCLKADISAEQYRELVKPLLEGDENYITFEGLQKRRDGSTYEASYRVWKLESEDGIILNEVVEDDSDHKQVLRLLQATFNSFPGGICVLDANLNLVIANHKLYELMNIPEAEFPIGCSYANMLRYLAERGEFGEGDAEAQVAERLAHAALFIEHTLERIRPDGTILEIVSSPLAGGGSVLTYMDVTARRRVEMEIRRHRDMLEEAVRERTVELEDKSTQLEAALEHERQVNQLQRQFVSMASHEFRTPLTVIDSAAQRLIRRAKSPEPDFVEQKAQTIRGAVERIVELMESILSAGRLDNGKVAINPVECPIGEIVNECCAKRQELSPRHKISIVLEDLPDTIRADKLAVHQIFTNLLSNAVKYSPDAPDIEVRGWRDGDAVKFAVRDHGLGVDKDDIPHMFERYFRARTATGIAGTGIGLSIIKQVVELHEGTIALESKAGRGSTFTVTLPINGPAGLPGDQEDAA